MQILIGALRILAHHGLSSPHGQLIAYLSGTAIPIERNIYRLVDSRLAHACVAEAHGTLADDSHVAVSLSYFFDLVELLMVDYLQMLLGPFSGG